jgi:hypothetical protein
MDEAPLLSGEAPPPIGDAPPTAGDPRLAGWAAWVPDEKPVTAFPVGEAPGDPPGTIAIVARGIDLNAGMSGEIRRASLFAGAMFLLTVGPMVALLIGVIVRAGSLEGIVDAIELGEPGSLRSIFGLGRFGPLVIAVGMSCFIAVWIDLQIVATAIVGGRAADRPVDLRAAVGIARRSFWRLILGSLAVGLLLLVPRLAVSMALERTPGETSLLVSTVIDVVLSAPFVYLGAAIVLGRGTALVAARASWRIARRRWRLALVVGIVNTAVSFIALFALGAGIDVVARIAGALGVGSGTGLVQAGQLAVILAVLVVAFGSLSMTVATLTTAPAVIAWLGLGGTTGGLPDRELPADAASRGPRLIALPMRIALVAEWALAVISLLSPA